MAKHSKNLGKGFLAGAIGGAFGTAILTAFQVGSLEGTRVVEERVSGDTKYTDEQEQLLQGFEKAHTKTAEVVAGAVGAKLSSGQKKHAAPVVEFAFGILCGGIYGALAEVLPQVTAGFGTIYGAVLFTGASEVVLPALGWVPPVDARTPVQHLGGLAGNVVYGACTEAGRRLSRKVLA